MGRKVEEVTLLGWPDKLNWSIEWPHNLETSGLSIDVPKDYKGEYATVFRIKVR